MERSARIGVFIGAFLFGFSIMLIILGMFFIKELFDTVTRDYIEVILGWLGATIIAGGIALKNYMDYGGGMGMGYQDDSPGDSAVSFVTGLSLALYALLATWLWIINVPEPVLVISLISSAMSFIGLVLISYFVSNSE